MPFFEVDWRKQPHRAVPEFVTDPALKKQWKLFAKRGYAWDKGLFIGYSMFTGIVAPMVGDLLGGLYAYMYIRSENEKFKSEFEKSLTDPVEIEAWRQARKRKEDTWSGAKIFAKFIVGLCPGFGDIAAFLLTRQPIWDGVLNTAAVMEDYEDILDGVDDNKGSGMLAFNFRGRKKGRRKKGGPGKKKRAQAKKASGKASSAPAPTGKAKSKKKKWG